MCTRTIGVVQFEAFEASDETDKLNEGMLAWVEDTPPEPPTYTEELDAFLKAIDDAGEPKPSGRRTATTTAKKVRSALDTLTKLC